MSITDSYKLHINNHLKCKMYTDHTHVKQILFYFCQLRIFRVIPHLLLLFYTTIIESILTLSITVWFSNLDSHAYKKLQHICNRASNTIGSLLPSLETLHHQPTIRRARINNLWLHIPGSLFFSASAFWEESQQVEFLRVRYHRSSDTDSRTVQSAERLIG